MIHGQFVKTLFMASDVALNRTAGIRLIAGLGYTHMIPYI